MPADAWCRAGDLRQESVTFDQSALELVTHAQTV